MLADEDITAQDLANYWPATFTKEGRLIVGRPHYGPGAIDDKGRFLVAYGRDVLAGVEGILEGKLTTKPKESIERNPPVITSSTVALLLSLGWFLQVAVGRDRAGYP
jgi:hypothetical protein